MKKRYFLFLMLTLLCTGGSLWGQVNMTTTGSYSQNFNGLISSGSATWTDNTTISNWYAQRSGTGNTIIADNGSSVAGGLYSFGPDGNTDRALGSIGSGTPNDLAWGLLLRNTSAYTISDIKISYTGEQWRNSGAAAQTVNFYFRTSNTSISALQPGESSGWTAVNALNFTSPITGGTAGALNGNAAANRTTFSNISIPSLSLAANDFIMIKWDDIDHSGSDHGLSIDDVTISWTVTPSSTNFYWNGPTTSGTGPTTGGSGDWNTTTTNWISPTDDNAGTSTAWATNNIANFTAGTGTGLVDIETDVISGGIHIASGRSYAFTASANHSIDGDITASGNLSLRGNNANLTVNDVITGTGNLDFTSSGTGSVTLNGNSTHSGAKALVSGLLNLGHANAMGSSGSFNISGGSMDNISGADITTPNYPQTWAGNFTYVGSIAGRDLNLGTGAVSLTGNWQVNVSANTLTVNGIISGAYQLEKTGAGTLTLGGNNTFTGGLLNNGTGTLNLNGTNTLGASATVANNLGTLNFSGTKSFGTLSITGGTVNLSGSSSYSNGTQIGAGSLVLGSANTLPSAGNFIFTGGDLTTGSSVGYGQSGLGTFTLDDGASTIHLGTGNHSIHFAASDALTWGSAGTLVIYGWTGTGGSSGTNGKIFFGSALATLTSAQRAKISFDGYTGTPILLSTGELVPFGPTTFTSVNNGDWNVASTWDQGSVPSAADNVIIDHNVYSNVAIVRNAGTTTTVNAGAGRSLAMTGANYTNNGTTSINGAFIINPGAWATGTNNFVYGAAGTLSITANSATPYDVNNGDVFWPATNGPFNVNVSNNTGLTGGVQLNNMNRTVAGTFTAGGTGASGLYLNNATLYLNGTAQINVNGYFNNTPVFGNASTLIYNTGASYVVGNEWTGGGNNTVAAGSGIPNNVIVSNAGTVVNMPAGARGLAGDLTINNSCTFHFNAAPGSDIFSKGNLIFNTGSTLNAEAKAFFFCKTGTQTISNQSGQTIPYIVFAPVSGSTTVQLTGDGLTVSAPGGGNAIAFSNAGDVFDINGQTLVLGTAGQANTISGAGTFKGSTSSNLTLLGNGSIGTLNFTSGSQILNNLVINRTAGQTAATLGTPLSLNGSGNAFTNGILNLGANNLTFTLSSGYTGGNANSFINTNGMGSVFKNISSSFLSFTYPIGDNVAPDGAQYSPATLNFTGTTSFSGFSAGLRVTDAVHPNMGASTDYLSRYWSLSTSGTITGPQYSFSGTYTNTDIVGTESNALAARWNGGAWTHGTAIGANTVSLTGISDLSSPNDFTARAATPCSDLFISEYVEGSSNNKFIEIYNPTSASITLTGNYRLAHYNNGSSTVTYTLNLTGVIAAYSTFIVANTGYSNSLFTGTVHQTDNSVMNFNGDDAIALQTAAGANIDVIGQIGNDPGSQWGTDPESTADNTLVRDYNIRTGDADGSNTFNPATEWEGFAQDDVSHLGWHSNDCNPEMAAYYRSKAAGPANWSNASSWEYSPTGSAPWSNATIPPTQHSSGITIRAGHTIVVNSSVSLDQTSIDGILETQTGSVLNIYDGTGHDISINNGGAWVLKNGNSDAYSTIIKQNGSASVRILTGGKISILGNGSTVAANLHQFATETRNVWEDHSIYDWNCPQGTMGWSGNTFFPNANSSTIPYLIMNATLSAPGGGSPTIVNGLLIVNTNFGITGNGSKTFRDGICGTATLTIPSSISGSINITGSAPVLGGVSLSINSDKNINIADGISLTVPADSVVSMLTGNASNFSKGSNSNFVVNGTANMGVFTITNSSGAVTINGTLRTAHPGGLENTGSGGTVSTISSVTNVNHGSTIEYNATVDQNVTGSTVLEPNGAGGDTYHHIKFSGSGTKTLLNAAAVHDSVSITGASVIVNAMTQNLGSGVGDKFIMDNGRLRLGTGGTQPVMNGPYNLTGGVVEFAATSGSQTIRGTATNAYQNIEVTGTDVANSLGNVNLNANGTFTIKSGAILSFSDVAIIGPIGTQTFTMENGAIFRVGNEYGFNGPDNFPIIPYFTPAVRSDIENITLNPGSTIDYNRALPLTSAAQTITTTLPYQHLILSGEYARIPNAGALLEIKGNLTKSGTSNFVHNEGTVLFSGTSAQNYTVNAGSGIMDFNNVTNNNTIALNINSDAGINQKLSMAASAKINLVDTADIILRSKLDTTAWVGVLPTSAQINYPGSGRFVVERYIKNVGNWNLIASPTAEAQTIYNSWQEGGANNAGYGTRITGPTGNVGGPINANGLDQYSIGYSMKWWDGNNALFRMKNVTNSPLSDSLVNRHTGYFLFARGDRSVPAGSTGTATTLRSRGKLYIGNSGSGITPPAISYTALAAGDFISIANPFASAIDPSLLTTSGLNLQYSVWDPTDWGSYGVGNYKTFSNTGGWITTPTPAPPSAYPAGTYKQIQSGQAFMMEANGTSASVSFEEADKIDGSLTFSRTPQDVVMMSTMLHTADGGIPDGNRVAFDAAYSDSVGIEDASKLMNGTENFGIAVGNKQIIIEGRPPLTEADTIFYRMANMRTQNYQLSFEPRNLGNTGLVAELIDQYLNSRTAVSLTDSTYYSFSITADAASKAANRFMLVFRTPGGTVPVTFVNIAAQRQTDRSIKINWEVANETNIAHYQVERSADGSGFTGILTQDATNSRHYTKNDLSPLANDNYYRIKAIGVAGDISYSNVVKVAPVKNNAGITVHPNPVRNKQLNIQFSQLQSGSYTIQLSNAAGQVLLSKNSMLNNSTQISSISLPSTFAAGSYQLIVFDKNGSSVFSEAILVE